MYELTLTSDERDAFGWVGDRYAAGAISDLLIALLPDDVEWCDDGDITFDVPEHVAWQIDELADEEDHAWPCFAPTLAAKLETFLAQIV